MTGPSVASAGPRNVRHRNRHGVAALTRMFAIPFGLIAMWEVLVRLGALPDYLVGPSAIVATAAQMITSGELWTHVSASLIRCYGGFILGASIGATAGLLAAVSGPLRSLFDPLVSLSYPVPKVAILPILMVWLGLGDASKIAIIALSVFYPLYISAHQGALAVSPLLVWSARTFGASRLRIFLLVIVPASLPAIFTGLRVGLAISFILLFAAEMVSANRGLGYLIVQAQQFHRFDIMFVAVAAIGFFGFVSDRLLMFAQRRLLAYRFATEGR